MNNHEQTGNFNCKGAGFGGLVGLGDELEKAVEAAVAEGREFNPEDRKTCADVFGESTTGKDWVLCALHIEARSPVAGLTVPARTRQTGTIVLGPYADRRDPATPDNLRRLLQAHRWVYNPVQMGDGVRKSKMAVAASPSIVPMNKCEVRCPTCGYSEIAWRDRLIVRTESRTPEGAVTCTKCNAEVTPKRLWCSALPNGRDGNDPVLPAGEEGEALLNSMLNAWIAGPPSSNDEGIRMPRIWMVYDAGKAPEVPDRWNGGMMDDRAMKLADKAAGYMSGGHRRPLDIVPWSVAREFHRSEPANTDLIEVWLEVPFGTQIGWVRRSNLHTAAGGWNMKFWSPAGEPATRVRRTAEYVLV